MTLSYKLKTKTFWVSDLTVAFDAPTANSPSIAVAVIREIWAQLQLDACQEHMVIFALNSRAKLAGYKVVSSGCETATLVTPAMVIRAGLLLGAASLIMVHNHPSGSPNPSQEDMELTRRCRAAGELVSLPIADHLILGARNFFSFRTAEAWKN